MTTATYKPEVGDVVGVVDDGGVERVGRIVVHAMWESDPLPWLVAFPADVGLDAWMDDDVQRVWLPASSLRLVARVSSSNESA